MKNFFTSLFGSRKMTGYSDDLMNPADVINTPLVDQSLFVENEPPVQESGPKPVNRKTILSRFLEEDYFNMGLRNGYARHSDTLFEITIRSLKARFRHCIDLQQQELNDRLHKLDLQLQTLGELAGELTGSLNLTRKRILTDLDRLEKEKELSAVDEGLVMTAIHAYHEGYILGVETYQQENGFLDAGGLF